MPELIADGPSIPVRLLNDLDSGRVVFFCGAGISSGPGSALPKFCDLVCHVYEANDMEPDDAEKEALDLVEPKRDRRRPAFDKALGLLERDERLGAGALRQTVVERLSAEPCGELSLHKALIDLSRHEKGIRLVTTNFDDRFVQAGVQVGTEIAPVDAAPKLPVPKPHAWSGLVHLHGRIAVNEDGSSLVLTAADFGRAYLTERWAARFVTELFRGFTVVFAGYSIGDPVMSYMVDALAAERAKGAPFATAYAFADWDGTGGAKSKTQARDKWIAKSVEPIVYDKRDDHRLLAETLIEWARLRKDPLHARPQIATKGLAEMPSGPEDPVAERVAWALDDPIAAKALADEPAAADEGEFAKLERWLDVLSERGLLCCHPSDFESSAPDHEPILARLIDHGHRAGNLNDLDMTRAHLAVWLARHLHVPQLLSWVLRNGGHLHPRLRRAVERQLAVRTVGDPDIPGQLRLLWTVLLQERPVSPLAGLWTREQHAAATSRAERFRVEELVVASMAPRLAVHAGPPPGLAFRQSFEEQSKLASPIDSCAHLRLMSCDGSAQHEVPEILEDATVLSRHAETLTAHLELALSLGVEDDKVPASSRLLRQSITPHCQNRYRDVWTRLINLSRNSYLALAVSQRKRAGNLLLRWAESPRMLFRRLALDALTEDAKADIGLAGGLLLSGRNPGLWDFEMRREVLRFFRLAGKRLPQKLRLEIVRAIHAGPKSKKGLGQFGSHDRLRHERALRLCKLRVSGARLDRKSRTLADEAAPCGKTDDDDRDEFLTWQHEVRAIGIDEFAPRDLVEGTVSDVVKALGEERVGQDELRGLVALQPQKVASALQILAQDGMWPAMYWQGFLWEMDWAGDPEASSAKSRNDVAGILSEAPDQLFKEVGSAAAGFVKDLAEEFGTSREAEFGKLWTKAWNGKEGTDPEASDLEDPLTDALNYSAGKLAEAALARLQKYAPQADAGIPAEIRPYFRAIGEDPYGHLGRVMLMTQLHNLFTIDRDWTAANLISWLSPAQSDEAVDLWFAFGWSPRLGPDLLGAFKEPFLEILRSVDADERKLRNLRGLFVTICLEAPEELAEQEIRHVVKASSEGGLMTVIRSLKRRLIGDVAERGQVWREKVHPWLDCYWPREAARNTAAVSEEIFALIAECGDAYPEAARWSLGFLRPTGGRFLFLLKENEHAKRHPDTTLRVLSKTVDKSLLEVYERPVLGEVLDAMVAAKSALKSDPQFQKTAQDFKKLNGCMDLLGRQRP